jgi:hypothetical protein
MTLLGGLLIASPIAGHQHQAAYREPTTNRRHKDVLAVSAFR